MRSELVGACRSQAEQTTASLEVTRSDAGLVRERARRDAWRRISGQRRHRPLGNASMTGGCPSTRLAAPHAGQ